MTVEEKVQKLLGCRSCGMCSGAAFLKDIQMILATVLGRKIKYAGEEIFLLNSSLMCSLV